MTVKLPGSVVADIVAAAEAIDCNAWPLTVSYWSPDGTHPDECLNQNAERHAATARRAEPVHFVVEETPNNIDESWIEQCRKWQQISDRQAEEVKRYCAEYQSLAEKLAELNQDAPAQAVDQQEVKKHRWNPQTMSFGIGEPPLLTQHLAGAVPAAVEPPKRSAPNVKPAISGLTTTAAEDHRLGRFKA